MACRFARICGGGAPPDEAIEILERSRFGLLRSLLVGFKTKVLREDSCDARGKVRTGPSRNLMPAAEALHGQVPALVAQLCFFHSAIAVLQKNEVRAVPLIGTGATEPLGLCEPFKDGLHDIVFFWAESFDQGGLLSAERLYAVVPRRKMDSIDAAMNLTASGVVRAANGSRNTDDVFRTAGTNIAVRKMVWPS